MTDADLQASALQTCFVLAAADAAALFPAFKSHLLGSSLLAGLGAISGPASVR